MTTRKHIMFVYGTLKQGHTRYRYLQGQRYLGIGITKPNYRIHQLAGHPAMVDAEQGAGSPIYGELYEIDEECLKQLDVVEAVAHGLYERKYLEFKEMNLAFLPTDTKVFEDYNSKQAEGYLYKRNVDGSRDCGAFWCKG